MSEQELANAIERARGKDGFFFVGDPHDIARNILAKRGVYSEWCRNPDACEGKGYCPLDPNCAD